MKRIKKNVMLLSALAVLAIGGGVGVASVNASAAEGETAPAITTTSFAVQEGVSILATGDGIRFKASISKSDLQTVQANYETVEFGMMICPTDYLTAGVTLDFDETDGLVLKTATSTTNYFSATICMAEETESGYEYYGSLTDILESNYSRPFTGRAFLRCSNAGEEAEYIYTDNSYSRSIYTQATYEVNDADAGYSEPILNSIYGIIDTVQAVYSDFNVSVTDKDGNAVESVAHGDVVKIVATVSDTNRAEENGTTAKTLEVCPTITTTDDSGVARLQLQEDGTYKVFGMGDFTYSVSSGKAEAANTLASGEQSVTCATQMQVLGGEDTLGNLKQNANTLIEYAGDYNQQVGFNETAKKDVFTFKNVDSTITDMAKNSFSFSDDVTTQMKKGTFLYFDMFIPSCSTYTLACRIDVQLGDAGGGPQIMYNNASKNTVDDTLYFQMYSTSGEKMTTALWSSSSTDRDTWIRIELKLSADWDNEHMYIGNYNAVNTDGVYLSNIILSQTQLTDIGAVATTSETTFDLLKGNEVTLNDGWFGVHSGADATLEMTSVDGIGENIYAWNWGSEKTAINTEITFTSSAKNYLKQGTYVYIDVYVTKATSVALYWNGANSLAYNALSGTLVPTNGESKGVTQATYQWYDGTTALQNTIWSGKSNGKWLTLEIYLDVDINAASNYTGLVIWNKSCTGPVYINNVRASKTSLFNN